MKKLVTAFVLATLVATPALARPYHPRESVAVRAVGPLAVGEPGYRAYAADNGANVHRGPAVISYGVNAGWDPDPNIRLQLMRDPGGVHAQ